MSDLVYEDFAAMYAELTDSAVDFGTLHDTLTEDPNVLRRLYLITDNLIDDAAKFNLTSITEPAEIIRKHLIDSLIPLSLIVDNVGLHSSIADVGTGGGFPLLPMAAALATVSPDTHLIGIDSTAKKISHILNAAAYVGLSNVSAVAGRAEELAAPSRKKTAGGTKGKGAKNAKNAKNVKVLDDTPTYRAAFDLVTARAVASLPVLLELCAPLLKRDGVFAALRSHADEELPSGDAAAAPLGLKREGKIDYELPGGDVRCVIFYRKISDTPDYLPRRYAEITKHPLG